MGKPGCGFHFWSSSARQGNRNTGELKTSWRVYTGSIFAASRHPGRPPGLLHLRIRPETLPLSLRCWRRRETATGLASTSPGPQFVLREDVPPFSEARALLPQVRQPQVVRPRRVPADKGPAVLIAVGAGPRSHVRWPGQ